MKPIFRYLGIIIFFIILCSSSFAQSHRIIRLAVFDNPQPDPSNNENSQQFVKSYLSGINTAITVATSKGISDVLNGASLKHPGNGLGLSGAKQYMENLNGKLELSSKLEIGTKVTLIFPIITGDFSQFPPERCSSN